jgi:hypothetical protein
MVAATNDFQSWEVFKLLLMSRFKIKDLGKLNYYLGIKITQTQDTITLDQSQYINNVISKFQMSNSKISNIPISKSDVSLLQYLASNNKFSEESKEITPYPYRELVGSLMYAMVATRPDLAYVVGILSRYLTLKISKAQYKIACNVLRYLKGTLNYNLQYSKSSNNRELIGFVDSDYAGCKVTQRSTSGYVFFLAGAPISWKSFRQKLVVISGTEAEFVALTEAAKEALWFRHILYELNYLPNQPIQIYEDNTGAIAIAKHPINHSRTKHIDIKYYFIRQSIQLNQISIQHIETKNQISDIFTKPLDTKLFTTFVKSLFSIDTTFLSNNHITSSIQV